MRSVGTRQTAARSTAPCLLGAQTSKTLRGCQDSRLVILPYVEQRLRLCRG